MTIFIDNGTTGTIGAVSEKGKALLFEEMPIIKQQDYTKAKKNVSRINGFELMIMLRRLATEHEGDEDTINVYLERPMVNPTRFTASICAVRALEATITVLETLCLGYQFVDSKEWQRRLLPSAGKKGTDSATLKQESHDIGIRMFPQYKTLIEKHKDADGILGAYALNKR